MKRIKAGQIIEVGKAKCMDCGKPHSQRIVELRADGTIRRASWSETDCKTYRRDSGHCWNCGIEL